ncbi:uncharacterized protein LOC132721105 [Ruditapes philippinarum]|uniref:uncharacterized protein LOC132721105 n=1 Tax=Ruditapes philippinarum TaxID=129788 RepID=UPI00295BD404|nr:uncharacterized protein LOC132721105 [Ruditapes philippinarum]
MEESSILSSLESLLDSRLQTFEKKINEISQNQISACTSGTYVFKKKGHEQQFMVNAKVMDKMRQADGYLATITEEDSNSSASSAREKISEGMDILSHRQKCLKLADSSEHGWRVVQEYESHPLADNSDDEKKIYKAQIQADRKVRQERRVRARRFSPYPATKALPASDSRPPNQQTANRKPGLCFKFGKPGHWRAECRMDLQADKNGNTQISINYGSFLLNGVEESDNFNIEKMKLSYKCSNDLIKNVSHMSDNDKILDKVVSPVGRLHNCIKHWQEAEPGEYILSVVSERYKLPFKTLLKSVELTNNRSARENAAFVSSEIRTLLTKGCIEEVTEAPFVVNPLTVAYNRHGKPRDDKNVQHLSRYLAPAQAALNSLH